ncbi:MAG: transcriptional regulator-like protein [Desulfomicrobiaceae bacterium]|jgi:predicted DNA-binding transcriptional regulator YafY|nr:transcriptional regulator-like protein [Desulfomicrobiaceae bacterium]
MTNKIRLPGCRPEPLMSYLKALGVFRLVAEQADPAARAAWEGDTFVLHTSLGEAELLAFFLSVELAQRYMGTDFQEPLASAVDKLSESLGGDITIDLETLRMHYTFAPPPLMSISAQTLLAIHQAIGEQRLMQIDYFANTSGKRSQRVIEPYHLCNTKGDWYLLAFDPRQDDKRTFHVGRISECAVLPDRFVRRASISIEDWIRSSFGAEGGGEPVEVVILFDAYQARWIRERRWHETAQLEHHDDGSVTLRLCTSGLGEVQRWVMQYGSHARVLQPESLRRAVAEEAQKMAGLYAAQ